MQEQIEITLRRSANPDLELFYLFQLDEEAIYLAAFTSKDATDKQAYLNKYSKFINDPTINMQTVIVDGRIVGSISKFELEGRSEITYWFDKNYWGKGIGSATLKKFLTIENSRPIYGRVAFDNIASQRVLEKCGFIKIGTDKGFANARQKEIEEFIYKLD